MKDYRLYYLDRWNGHIEEVEEFAAPGDGEAIAAAATRGDHRARELWHGHHKLKHWDEPANATD